MAGVCRSVTKVLDSVCTDDLCVGVLRVHCLASWEWTVEEKVLHTVGSLNPGHLQKIWSVTEIFLYVVIR